MILPKLDQLINDLYVYWGKEMGSFLICYAGVVRASIRNEKTFVMWVNRLISYFEDIIANDVPLPPLRSTIVHMKELLSWKTEEEFFDLLLQTYEDNIWYCIRGAGEAILSETSDNTDVAWTTGYDQFCYEIFKPLLSGTKERYADFKKNKTRVLKGFVVPSDANDVQYIINKEAHRFRDVFNAYAKLRKDEIFLQGVKNHERNPTVQDVLPIGYSKEKHRNLIKGRSPKIIPRFAYHTNVLFYYASTPKPKYVKGPKNLVKGNDSIQKMSEESYADILREELILRSFANLVQQVYDIKDEQQALSKASLLLNSARKEWCVYKSALRNGRLPSEELTKKCILNDMEQWERFRYEYLKQNVYYKYIMLLEQERFSEITDTFPQSERAKWRERFQTGFEKIEGLTVFEWLSCLPSSQSRRPWERTIAEMYDYQRHQMTDIGEIRVNSAIGQLLTLANQFICSIQQFFFVLFYIVGHSDYLPPDALLKVLDSWTEVHPMRDNM